MAQRPCRSRLRLWLAAGCLLAAAGSGSAGVVVTTSLSEGAPSVWRVVRQTSDVDGLLAWDSLPSVALAARAGDRSLQRMAARSAITSDAALGVVTDDELRGAGLVDALGPPTDPVTPVQMLMERHAAVILGFVSDAGERDRLSQYAAAAGYEIVRTRQALLSVGPDAQRVFGAFDPGSLVRPTIPEMAEVALRVMSRHSRGFLAIEMAIGESEAPDIERLADLDRTVAAVRRWTSERLDALHLSFAPGGPRGLSVRALSSPLSRIVSGERCIMSPASRNGGCFAVRFVDASEDGLIRAEGAFADGVRGVLEYDELQGIVNAALGEAAPTPSGGMLTLLSSVALPGAEIIDWDGFEQRLVATWAEGVAIIDVRRPREPSVIRTIRLEAWRGRGHDIRDVTHVAVDPAGRGVAAASCPSRRGDPGMVCFVDLSNGDLLSFVEVGSLPDAVAFTPAGDALVVANEGEPIIESGRLIDDPPGSASIIRLSGLSSVSEFRSLPPTAVEVPFDKAAISSCTDVRGMRLRIHPSVSHHEAARDIEPESLVITPHGAFVTLQENNGVAVLDIASGAWRRIVSLGVADRVIDGCDDGRIDVSSRVRTMRMPDQLAAFEVDHRWYIITADEGESRASVGDGPRGDTARLDALLSAATQSVRERVIGPNGLSGRLRACAFSGDTDADGRIDEVVIPGARSASIFDARTMELVGDTGSQFELMLAADHPQIFNASWQSPTEPDTRSDQRGPEPEGVTVGRVGERTLAFVGLERPGAIAIVDVSDPTSPRTIEIVNTCASGLLAPEGLKFIDASSSPTGAPLLAVGFEGSGHIAIYSVRASERVAD